MVQGKLDRNILIPNIFYSLLFFGFASASFMDDQPYCALRYRRLCQGKGRHVGCQYPYPGPGEGCQNYSQIKFTAELRHFVISYINRRRQRIAAGTERVRGGALIPKPQIMMMVVWDRELALLAQRLADQCSFIHDDCRATVRYPYSGQTVGEVRWRGSRVSDALSAQRAVRRVLDAWWGERRRVTPQQLVAPFRVDNKGSAWGHFSQLAVWQLTAAGCGAARHASPPRLLLVCDFSHTNMLGQSTLVSGESVPCPPRFVRRSRAYPLLCAPVHIPDQAGSADSEEYSSYEEYAPKFSDDEDVTTTVTDKEMTHTERIQTKGPMRSKDSGKYINATKQYLIGKLEQELEVQTAQFKATRYHKKLTTRVHFGDIRVNHESENLKSRFKIIKAKPNHSAEEIITQTARRKWKNTRQRPRRPGADALISKPAQKILEHSSGVSLRLDREDMEQLFRDTGFHKNWKKESLP